METLGKIKAYVSPLFDAIDEHFQTFEPLVKIAEVVKLRPAHILIVGFVLAVVALGTGIFSHLFVAVFGMIYPSYMTFKALTSSDSEKCKEWLTYWIIFGFFTALSGMLRHVFFFLSLRSYNVFRVLFYVFLFHPVTRGAALIYNKCLRKTLIQGTTEFEERVKQL